MNRRGYAGIKNPAYVHGLHKSPTWYSWTFMKQRCLNPKRPDYKYYGGRGIGVHSKWLLFGEFVKDMGIRPDGHTLDRINVNGNYEPTNCRWATKKQQLINKRPYAHLLKHDALGRFKKKTLGEA